MPLKKSHKDRVRKVLEKELRGDEELPKSFQNSVVAKSKKGPMGQIIVRRFSGIERNTAVDSLRQFEENVGGKAEVADKLALVSKGLDKDMRVLLSLLKSSSKKGLATLVAEAGIEPTKVMKTYASACIELGKVNAAIEAHKDLPRLIKQFYKDALDKEGICRGCGGEGMQKRKATDRKATLVCLECDGSGVKVMISDSKQFAQQKILEVTKSIEKGGGNVVNVNQQVAVKGGSDGGFFERQVSTSDEILYGQREAPIEAEVVKED